MTMGPPRLHRTSDSPYLPLTCFVQAVSVGKDEMLCIYLLNHVKSSLAYDTAELVSNHKEDYIIERSVNDMAWHPFLVLSSYRRIEREESTLRII